MTISAEKKQHLLNDILSIRFLIEEEQPRNTAESLVQFENLLTLDEIESSLISTPLTELADNLTQILSKRWERIRQSTLSYTQQPLSKAKSESLPRDRFSPSMD